MHFNSTEREKNGITTWCNEMLCYQSLEGDIQVSQQSEDWIRTDV